MTLPFVPVLPIIAKAPVSPLDPATLFALGEEGAWYDPSDITTLFQDEAGTVPITTLGQTIARINDKSGRGHDWQSGVSGNTACTWAQDGSGNYYFQTDGVSDGFQSLLFTAGDWSSTMLVSFGVVIENAGLAVTFYNSNVTVQRYVSGGAAPITLNIGTPTTYVNGVAVSPDTNGAFYTAMGEDTPCVVDCSPCDMSAAIRFSYGGYADFGGAYLEGRCYGMIATEHTELIADVRAYMASKTGVSI